MSRENGFGALRLFLAALVIFAHGPELLDGDRSREAMTQVFHTSLTLGSVAVDGFFLISGYLIAGSFISDPKGYFLKRTLRIYPAFLVCSILSLVLIAPLLGGATPTAMEWVRAVYRMATLQTPLAETAGVGLHIQTLNASMWTIAYEFRCYILAAAFGLVGLYSRPRLFSALAVAMVAASLVPLPELASPRLANLIGQPDETVRLLGAFMVGTAFRVTRLNFDGRIAAICAAATLPLLFLEGVGEAALILLGGYAMFWFALKVRWSPLLTLNAKDDISYGLYLYAWPVSALLIWYWRDIPLEALLGLTLALSVACGAASWFLIEKPAMRFARPGLSRELKAVRAAP